MDVIPKPELFDLSSRRQLYDLMYHVESLKSGNLLEINEFAEDFENLDVEKFKLAYATMFQRHESLRTVFRLVNNLVKQEVHPYSAGRFYMIMHDLRRTDSTSSESERSKAEEKVKSAFAEVDKGPLAQGILFRLTDVSFSFVFYCHHILADGHSMKLISTELLTAYGDLLQDKAISLPPVKLSCREFLRQRNELATADYEKRFQTYWEDKFAQYLIPVHTQTLYRNLRLPRQTSFTAAEHNPKKDFHNARWYGYTTAYSEKQRLVEFSRCLEVTPQVVLLTVFFLCIHICYGSGTAMLTTMVPGRNDKVSRQIVGNLFGNVFLKSVVHPSMALREIMMKIYMDFMQSCRYPIFNFEKFDRFETREKCEFLFNFLQTNDHKELTVSADDHYVHMPDKEYYSLSLVVNEYRDGFTFRWVYQDNIYSQGIIECIAKTYLIILREFIVNPVASLEHVANVAGIDAI